MKHLILFGFAAIFVLPVVLFATAVGLSAAFAGVVGGIGIGLGTAMIGLIVPLVKLATGVAGPIFIILGILLAVKIFEKL